MFAVGEVGESAVFAAGVEDDADSVAANVVTSALLPVAAFSVLPACIALPSRLRDLSAGLFPDPFTGSGAAGASVAVAGSTSCTGDATTSGL